jgi:hypothetical protein
MGVLYAKTINFIEKQQRRAPRTMVWLIDVFSTIHRGGAETDLTF